MGETGLLVAPDDAEAAAEVIRRLLEDDDLRTKLAENGQKHAQGYDWGGGDCEAISHIVFGIKMDGQTRFAII